MSVLGIAVTPSESLPFHAIPLGAIRNSENVHEQSVLFFGYPGGENVSILPSSGDIPWYIRSNCVVITGCRGGGGKERTRCGV